MNECPHCHKPFENAPSPRGCRVVCSACNHLVYPPEYGIAPASLSASPAESSYDKCSRCEVNPNLPEYKGRQIYKCDRCGALVCSDCSENEPNNEIFCLPCDYRVQLHD